METEIVSNKLLLLCFSVSSIFLICRTVSTVLFSNYLYICNDNHVLDIYKRNNQKDVLLSPKSIKNTLSCMSRGMIFYDRSIEKVEGRVSPKMFSELKKRYAVGDYIENNTKLYYCDGSNKRILIFQKEISLNVLNEAIEECKPKTIVVAAKYKENRVIRALLSRKYDVIFLNNGEYKKITL